MIIKDKKEQFLAYLEDTSNIKGEASLLYIPQNKKELSWSISECRDKNMPFTMSAGRTGTTGGCTPYQGAVISLERLNRIIDIDKENQVAEVESGVSLENLEKEANKAGLTLRASPTEPLALIGGAVSTSASGVRGFGYGGIRNYILEIEVFLTNGCVLNIKRGDIISKSKLFDFKAGGRDFKFRVPSYRMPRVKSQAGYFVSDDMDLIDLFIGSEGTLGVLASCKVKLQKVPFNMFDGLVFFKKENDALLFVSKVKDLKKRGGLHPSSLEFFDRNSLNMLRQEFSFIPICKGAVYFEQEVRADDEYKSLIDKWQSLIEESGASCDDSILADTPRERERIFEFRHKLPQLINEFLRKNNQVKTASDIAVPWENFFSMYDFYKKTGESSRINYVNFGHIGESHLHFNFLPVSGEENLKARAYIESFCRRASDLGGTVSAEHGIGKIKKPYLRIMYNEKEIKEMAGIKKYFDSTCLLGLDNIFDKEILRGI